MEVYDVQTDLPPEALTEVAIEAFNQWLSFALGQSSLGGKTLAFPSGRYAASLSWKKTGAASVAIIADEEVAPEAGAIETGTAAHSMKEAMLGQGNTKIDKDGFRYRVIPIRKNADAPDASTTQIVGSPTRGQRIGAKSKKMWAQPRLSSNGDHFAVMSDRPGSSDWIVPAMPAYAPAYILSELIKKAAALYG